MEIDLFTSLKEQFSLDTEQVENLISNLLSDKISKQITNKNPKLIIIGGQEGSFKENLQEFALKDLSNNALVLSKENLRKYHPNYAEIQAKYPDMVQYFTEDLAKSLLLNLENQAIDKSLNVVLVASLGNYEAIIQKISQYKNYHYTIDLRILSINKLFSYLNSEESYEQLIISGNLGRNISKQHHDKNYEAIETTLQKIKQKDLLDDVEVYKVKIQEIDGICDIMIVPLTNDKNNFIDAYLQERNRDFTATELAFLKTKAQRVLDMKSSRDAIFLEKVRFDTNFKFILEGKGIHGLRYEKGIKKI